MTDTKLQAEHRTAAIRQRLAREPKPSYLRDWVYGGIDGAVTTFAIVAGVIGADLSTRIVLVLGLANLLADGFSMAAGNYSGTKSEIDDYERLRSIEHHHIDQVPDGETEEIRQILSKKGLDGEILEQATAAVTADRDGWVEMMMQEEYGLSRIVRSPLKAAVTTFVAFLIFGAVPLLPFALGLPNPIVISIVATGCVFAAIGAMKSKWSLAPAWWSAIETLLIGAAAATVAFVVGYLLKSII